MCIQNKNSDEIIKKTALHLAIERKNSQIASLLLKHRYINVNSIMSDSLSFEYDYFGDHDEEIECSGEFYMKTSALLMAIQQNCQEIVEMLVNNPKTNINIKETINFSYEYSFTNSKNDFDCNDSGVDEKSVLCYALGNNNVNSVRRL